MPSTGKPLSLLYKRPGVAQVRFSAGGDYLICDYEGAEIVIWDMQTVRGKEFDQAPGRHCYAQFFLLTVHCWLLVATMVVCVYGEGTTAVKYLPAWATVRATSVFV